MIFNETTLKGKWNEIRGEIRKTWGRLTDDELERSKGDLTAIGGLIQQRYGEQKEIYAQKLSDIFARFDVRREHTVENLKETLKRERVDLL